MAETGAVRSRRAFLGGERPPPRGPRPPWAGAAFDAACTGCGSCVEACPEGILVLGGHGLVEVDVRRGAGACTFCAACVERG